MPAAMLHDAIHRGESEPGPFADFFRREERLENPAHRGLIHACSGITDREQDVASRFHGKMLRSEDLIEFYRGSFKNELAAARHGIARVDREI